MRVIAGSARRLQLKTIPGNDTRPTTDQIKETLFNMINFDLPGSEFLDLYSGSGAIGIEALSRGTSRAVFVENNPKAIAVINENLVHTGLSDRAVVINADAVSAIRKLRTMGQSRFDIVFMDPPYDKGLEDLSLAALRDSNLIDSDSMVIVEMSFKADVSHFDALGYDIEKVKNYKTNKHVYLRRKTL